MSRDGIYVVLGGSMAQVLQGMFLGPLVSLPGRKKMGMMGIAKVNQKDLVFMKELLVTGKIVPVIDRCYSLNETSKAIRYLVKEHAKGKVVIKCGA